MNIMNLYHSDLIKLIQTEAGVWNKEKDQPHVIAADCQGKIKQHSLLNPLCGDQVTWYACLESEKFTLLAHETVGCILCQAASILTYQQLLGKPITQVRQLIEKNQLNQSLPCYVGEWKLFNPVLANKSRLKCVSLPILALQQLLVQN